LYRSLLAGKSPSSSEFRGAALPGVGAILRLGAVSGVGRWSARNRWPVLSAWLTAVVLSLLSLPQLLSSMGAPSPAIDGSPSSRASALIAAQVPQLGQEQLFLIVRSERHTVGDPAFDAAIAAAAGALRADPGVASVLALPKPGEPGALAALAGVYRDPHNAYALVGVVGDGSARQLNVPRQRDAAAAAVPAGFEAMLLGESTVNYDLRGVELADLARAELIAVPLALLILLLGLGSLASAAAPLVLAGASVTVTLGIFGLLAPAAGFDVVLLTIVCMVGVAVGIDYALLVVSRFREELGLGAPPERAAATAVATAGRTVLYSGLVVMLASGSLLSVRSQVFREFAFGTALVITVTLVAVHTLLPALLVLGARWLRGRRDEGNLRWARWARHLMRHPWRYTVAAAVILVLCAAPALDLRLGVDFGRSAIVDTPSGRALQVVDRDGLSGAAGSINVVLPREDPALADRLRADPAVAAVASLDDEILVVLPKAAPDVSDAVGLATRVRDQLPEGALMGGPGGLLLDVTEETAGKFWWVVGFVLGLSMLLLTVILRSIVLPLKAILMNLLATSAALGLTVLVFGSIQVHLPLVIFTVLFGLSMDYEVFLVRRIQEEYRRDGDNGAAVAEGLRRTARLITVAAAIMVVVFASMVASRALELRQLGFALAAAVIMDATVIRLVLVPALMQLLGRWNWWPGIPTVIPAPRTGYTNTAEKVKWPPNSENTILSDKR
jgi:putative drug exporter of the RND superfamily